MRPAECLTAEHSAGPRRMAHKAYPPDDRLRDRPSGPGCRQIPASYAALAQSAA